MKNKFIVIYTIIISLAYALGISFFGYSVFNEYSKAKVNPSYLPNIVSIHDSIVKAFFIILGATILTIIILILNKDDNYNEINSKNTFFNEEKSETDSEDNENEMDVNKEVTAPQTVIEHSQEPSLQVIPTPENINSNVNTTVENKPVEEPKTVIQDSRLPSEEFKPVNMIPEGLFSPVTGFGWESYLLTRLDGELKRAISSEFDLSLFIIRIPGLDRNTAVIQEICNYLTVQFQFKDLLFEYQNDCFAAIKTNINLDDALDFADKIHFEINYMLEKVEKKCYIGISTRTIRIISGERLLNEAHEALKHAQEDEENPIIAFRANAEKYLKLIQKQNEQQ